MSKPPTYPTLFDEVLQLQISKLKEWNYLKDNQILKGSISWSSNGVETASISIIVNTKTPSPYVELRYNYKGEPVSYTIQLSKQNSNLNKGYYYYFICPKTHRQARKLYLFNGYFLHRSAIKDGMYSSQVRSKFYRYLDSNFKDFIQADKIYDEIYKKHFKTHYAGKPTKKYLKLLKKTEKLKNVNTNEFFSLMK